MKWKVTMKYRGKNGMKTLRANVEADDISDVMEHIDDDVKFPESDPKEVTFFSFEVRRA